MNEVLEECLNDGQFKIGERITGNYSFICFRFAETTINQKGMISHDIFDKPEMEAI